jgi:hypothetical protein
MSDGGGGPEDSDPRTANDKYGAPGSRTGVSQVNRVCINPVSISPGSTSLVGEPGDSIGGGDWTAGAGGVMSACVGCKFRNGTGDFFFSGLANDDVGNGGSLGSAAVLKD